MMKVAIYGKGGIGKSTTTSNLSIALSELGYKVLQIGCDPKADSTRLVMHGRNIPTVLDMIRSKQDEIYLEDLVYEGVNGVLCVEAGGPMPGVGCAGRGIITAFEKLEELEAYEIYRPDIVLYDVLGDVVCGGFAMPLRAEYADIVFIVTSGEMMAMYAASNIASALENFKVRGYAKLGGLILNSRNVEGEIEQVEKLAKEIHTDITGIIPRAKEIQAGESMLRPAIEAFPESDVANCYRSLAEKIIEVYANETNNI